MGLKNGLLKHNDVVYTVVSQLSAHILSSTKLGMLILTFSLLQLHTHDILIYVANTENHCYCYNKTSHNFSVVISVSNSGIERSTHLLQFTLER